MSKSNKTAYVITQSLIAHLLGEVSDFNRFGMAGSPDSNDEEKLEAIVRGWEVEGLPVGRHLLSIVELSKTHRRTGAHPVNEPRKLQVRRVSFPRSLSRLLGDLKKGRAIAVVLPGSGAACVAGWCILDTNPGSATESFIRQRLRIVEKFPYYKGGKSPLDRGPRAGEAPLLISTTGEKPRVATIVQIFRVQSLSSWSGGPHPADLNKHLSNELWRVMGPFLENLGIQVLIGEMLHAVDAEPVQKIGTLPIGWSFYSNHGFKPTGVHEQHDWTAPDGKISCKLTYEIMVAGLSGLRLVCPADVPASLQPPLEDSRRTSVPATV